MRFRRKCLALAPLLLVLPITGVRAQTDAGSRAPGETELYAGYSYLSNSFNSHTGFSGGGLNGWDASVKLPLSNSFGVKIAAIGEYGSSLGDAQRAHFIMGGGQYGWRFGASSAYVHGLVGLGHINAQALTLGGQGPNSDSSLTEDAGGGFNVPFSRRMAWRIEAAMLHADFTPASNQIHDTPNYFARISTGVVWRF